MKTASFLLFLLLQLPLKAQTLRFEIRIIGSKAGELTATRTISANSESYAIISHASANLLVTKVSVDNTLRCTYTDGMLTSGYARNDKNGEVEKYADTKWNGSSYQVQTENGKLDVAGKVTWSVGKLYFNEPAGITRIYSEVWGQFIGVVAGVAHSYTLQIPNGKTSTFIYENGALARIETDTKAGKVKVVRID